MEFDILQKLRAQEGKCVDYKGRKYILEGVNSISITTNISDNNNSYSITCHVRDVESNERKHIDDEELQMLFLTEN